LGHSVWHGLQFAPVNWCASGDVVFTAIHKFMPEGGCQMAALSGRENIVVIADEPDQVPRYSLGISFTV